MSVRLYVWIIFVQLIVDVLYVDALVCLNCDAVAHPRLCSHVTQCFPGEKCGMETYIGEGGYMVYKLGCVDSNTCTLEDATTPDYGNQFFSCHDCCEGRDLCNVRGCNSTGYPAERGPICYSCDDQLEGTSCNRIEHCEPHEVCHTEVKLEFQQDRLVTSGCISKHNCGVQTVDPLIGIGKRTIHVCSDCCEGDMCNIQCENADISSDDSKCNLLMTNFDVCTSQDVALQFCKKTCGLCPNSGSTHCQDTRFDCEYLHNYIDMCTSETQAKDYGCLHFCGFCSFHHTHAHYTHTTPTFPSYTHTTPTFVSYTHTTPVFPPGQITLGTTTAKTRNWTFNIGDHVIRGPDWHNGNQDDNGPGTVINTDRDSNLTIFPGMVQVLWYLTNMTESYRVGANGMYEIRPYHGPFPPNANNTTVTPKTTLFSSGSKPVLSRGDLVVRGPDWTGGNSDGNSTGVVIGVRNGWVNVTWNATNITHAYRYGYNQVYEVQPVSSTMAYTSIASRTTASAYPPTTTSVSWKTTTAYDQYNFNLGDRVVRGPDWRWGDQDGHGEGTVVDSSIQGWVRVDWDNNFSNLYRNGIGGARDIIKIRPPTPPTKKSTLFASPSTPPTTTSAPPTAGPALANDMYVGAIVQRGRDWRYGSQDSNGEGTVIDIDRIRGWVKVQWTTGYINDYRLGAENAYDVMFVPDKYNPSVSGG